MLIKKCRSMLTTLAIILALGLVFLPAQARAEGSGPQNTSNSQSTGSSGPTLSDILRLILMTIRF
jgi:predicted secreted Zn-dependent protease